MSVEMQHTAIAGLIILVIVRHSQRHIKQMVPRQTTLFPNERRMDRD